MERTRSKGRATRGLISAIAALLTLAATIIPALPAAAAALTSIGFALSSPVGGATGVTYTWTFTLATSANLTSVQVSVPTGTGGSPTTVAMNGDAGYAISFPVGTTTILGTTVTVPITAPTWGPGGTVVTLTVAGLTNTSTAGDYSTTITTFAGGPALDTATGGSATIASGALTGPYWWATPAVMSASSTWTMQFTTATTATLASVVITAPSTIAGTPTLSSVSGLPTGGTVSRSGATITYAFAATSVAASTAVTLAIAGITNPSIAGGYSIVIVTRTATAPVDAVRTDTTTFTGGALVSPTWSAASTTVGATGVSYTYQFGIATTQWTDRFTVQLPPGTGGTPTLTLLTSTGPVSNPLSGGSVSRSGTTLTVDFTAAYLNAGWVATVVVGGMTNTATVGSYVAPIVTRWVAGGFILDSGTAPAQSFTSTAMTALSWSASSTVVGSTAVTYLYSFSLSAATTVGSVTMTVPAGTGGTPTVGTITPAAIAGGTVGLSGTTLTYTFPSPQSITTSMTLQIRIGGLTNTGTAGTYTSSVVALQGASVVASGTSPPVGFSAGALVSPSWTSSSQVTGAASTYTFGMTTPAAGMTATSITFTLPAGTTGTPALGAVSAFYASGPLTFTGTSISVSGTTLTFSFTGPYLQPSTTISVGVTGLTNTTTPGSYSSAMTIFNGPNPVASGSSAAVAFSSVSMSSASWTASSSVAGSTGVTYTFGVTISVSSAVSSITMTLPAGTAGTPALGTVTPAGFAGGTLTSSGGVLTYAFTSATLAAGQSLSISVTGLTNTSVTGSYTSTLTLFASGATIVASGTSSSVSFTASALSGVTWTSSSNATSATGVTYTWALTTGITGTLSEVTASVPVGTGGTPTLVSATTSPTVTLAGATVSLTGTTLTLSFTGIHVPTGTTFTIVVSGFTNTSSAGSFTSSVVTQNASVPQQSGVSSTLTLVTPTPASLTWSASNLVAGTPSITETFVFTTSSSATLNSLVLALPAATTGTPTISSLTPAGIATGATVALSGSTLTLTFTATSIAASTAINLTVAGLTQTSAAGSYTVTGMTKNGTTVVDTAESGPLTVAARTLTTTITCGAANACRTLPGGSTELEILLIPGAAAPVTASVGLTVKTNAPNGYLVSVASTALTSGTTVLPQASTSGVATVDPNRFGATAGLTGGGTSSAALCGAWAGAWAQIGYPTSATSLWSAPSGTGATIDSAVLSNKLRVSATQPAGLYTGTITYTVLPRYTSGTGC